LNSVINRFNIIGGVALLFSNFMKEFFKLYSKFKFSDPEKFKNEIENLEKKWLYLKLETILHKFARRILIPTEGSGALTHQIFFDQFITDTVSIAYI
jgi:hypothetical protein